MVDSDVRDDPHVALMLRFQNGDEEAFDAIVEAYKRPIMGLCYRYLRNRVLAEGASQDVFVKLYEARERYKPSGAFKSYLFRIAANHCINLYKKEKRRRHLSLEHPNPETGEMMRSGLEGDDSGPHATLERKERAERVHEALEELPETQRMAIVLNKFHGHAYAEIAEIMETTVSAVKSLLFRARQNLKEVLEEFIEG